jgi:hypothetical protein
MELRRSEEVNSDEEFDQFAETCPCCGGEPVEQKIAVWRELPTPEQLIDGWEKLNKPGHVVISSRLWNAYIKYEGEIPLHPLFAADAVPTEDIVRCEHVISAGYWMRGGH